MAFLQLETLWISDADAGVASIMLDVPGNGDNTVSVRVLRDLNTALDRISQENRFRAIAIRSGKANQFATGPDIDDLARLKTPEEFAEFARRGQDVFQKLESLPIPSVAVIGGGCLGAGLELALACDYRVAVPGNVRFGMNPPSVLPAWGGTQRLPRLIGLERALMMLVRGRQLSAQAAFNWQLIDAILTDADGQLLQLLEQPRKRTLSYLPLHTWRQWFFERFRGGRWLILHGMEVLLKRRFPEDLPAPWETLAAVRKGFETGRQAGYEFERAALARIGPSEAFQHLLHSQQAVAELRKTAAPTPAAITGIGMVGADTRGLQILVLAIEQGFQVVVREAGDTALGRAMYQLMSMLMPGAQAQGLKPHQVQDRLAGIKGTTAWKGFAELDLVLEATGITPDERINLFREVEKEIRPDTLLATLASQPPLSELRGESRHPQRLTRLHFQFPLQRNGLVELVGPPDADADVAQRLSAWVIQLGCIPVLVRDRPGLLVERIWLAALQEAIVLLQEGIAPRRIDDALRRFGMSSGPLERADLIGLDRMNSLAGQLEALLPERFFQDEILAQMIDKGWLGQKTRLGFYDYTRRRLNRNAQLQALLRGMRDLDAPATPLLSTQEQLDRCRERVVLRTVNESAWCLAEGVVDRAETLDLALALAGWAPHRGGPLTYARRRGSAEVVGSLEKLAQECGARFHPCPLLGTTTATGR